MPCLSYVRCENRWSEMGIDIRELPVETQKNAFQTPDIANIPYPVHERQLGSEDHVLHFALWD